MAQIDFEIQHLRREQEKTNGLLEKILKALKNIEDNTGAAL